MEPVGLFSIVKLTKRMIVKNLREYVCIALLLAIPYAFDLIALDLSTFALDSAVSFVFAMFKIISSKEQFLSPQLAAATTTTTTTTSTTNDPPFPQLDLSHISFTPFIANFLFSLIIPLLSTPLLTLSVCRSCLNKSLDLKGSLLSTPRCVKNLALASLCIGAVFFACAACMIGVLGIVGAVIAITNGNMAVLVVMFGIWIAIGVCGVYVAIVFSMTHTVAIVEEKRGWGAMKRSMELLNGRKWVALGLACVVYGMSLPCDFSVLWLWRGATILKVSWQTVTALFRMSSRVVLYMSCRRELEEPLHIISQFGPLDSSLPSSMDLETTPLFTQL